jgi:hypothetical protein
MDTGESAMPPERILCRTAQLSLAQLSSAQLCICIVQGSLTVGQTAACLTRCDFVRENA